MSSHITKKILLEYLNKIDDDAKFYIDRQSFLDAECDMSTYYMAPVRSISLFHEDNIPRIVFGIDY